ncbi:universal stress protein [Pseudarthrobacter sp. PS3-L1]|uniref:universal stress protein n=1 Tax=Pseudarthrobacter sp. PS3-L1 TaxID=3046207 RepID=UPI0024BAB3F9|nr:universal stress protein [Pseudarthrobacter sp. PS3-L1]MDJ0320909.1 universal stress protein [Pseudarthrobacter sp. PS3-L1]
MSTHLSPLRRIIVGVDGSESSVEALRQAQRLAQPVDAKITATAFWDYPQIYDGYLAQGIDGFEESAEALLRQAVQDAFGHDTPANVEPTLVRGHPREGLIEATRAADLVVVGRRGHGAFGGLLLGSVSSACVAHAHCPVLVVHAPQKQGVKPDEKS